MEEKRKCNGLQVVGFIIIIFFCWSREGRINRSCLEVGEVSLSEVTQAWLSCISFPALCSCVGDTQGGCSAGFSSAFLKQPVIPRLLEWREKLEQMPHAGPVNGESQQSRRFLIHVVGNQHCLVVFERQNREVLEPQLNFS